eukprot:TRINITY_DN380_c4_g1_i1.p1 TRINITY_DN380_c4_g1~~TRINITY_DN380_c4_g1_i1.p1  ORF type:complete len:311 (+),score=25.40 TRINITY_DN380_c4_g1_i1:82-1014(+)
MPSNRFWGFALILSAAVVIGGFSTLETPTDLEPTANFRGIVAPQAYHVMPSLRWTYKTIESEYNVGPMLQVSKDHWQIPIVAVVVYLVIVFGIKGFMKDREAFDLRVLFAWWNWFLAVFSIMGAIRTVPHILYNVSGSLESAICDEPQSHWGVGATGLWVQLFIYSKIPELLDTVFIVLRKRNLIFLHWYHHVTVLLYCWHSYATECGAGLFFVSMNFLVHAFMYSYFAFSTLRLVPKWFPVFIITGMQLAQMFVGMFICGVSWYYKLTRPCANDFTNLQLGGVMYLTYFGLFLHFAFGKYFGAAKQKTN